MTFRLGLTGSIGMGKSTTAELFAQAGCAVWDADAAVHRLYSKNGMAVPSLAKLFPEAVIKGAVSREKLKLIIENDPSALELIENVVHPLIALDRDAFVDDTTAKIVVFDIPILFENGADKSMNAVAVVSVSRDVQKERVMARGTMTEAQFDMILKKQMPDAKKRALADYVIVTDTMEHARQQVEDVLSDIRKRLENA